MIGLNLLPDIKKEFIKSQRTRNFVISLSVLGMIVAVGATVALAMFVYVGQNTAIKLQEDAIKKNQAEFSDKPEIDKYLTIQNQLGALEGLHSKDYKYIYSRFLDYLVKLNPAQPHSVELSNISLSSDDKTISLQGSTLNFRGLNVYKSTLEKAIFSYQIGEEKYEIPLFDTVSLEAASLTESDGQSRVSFSMNLSFVTEIFQPDIVNPNITIPQLVISDSLDNAPVISTETQEVEDGE